MPERKPLIITTSREPSRRTRSFLKDLVQTIPASIKFNRGKATLQDLASIARRRGAYGVLIVLERKANPSALLYTEPTPEGLERKVLLKIWSVSLIREIPDCQRPIGIDKLILNTRSVPEEGLAGEAADALALIFRPILTDKEILDAVEMIVGEGEKGVKISFICTSTGRPCGPRFTVLKVVRYGGEQGERRQ